jgi:hypothetical protein
MAHLYLLVVVWVIFQVINTFIPLEHKFCRSMTITSKIIVQIVKKKLYFLVSYNQTLMLQTLHLLGYATLPALVVKISTSGI